MTELHDGLHEPIIARDLWDRVHAAMGVARRDTTSRWTHTHLLKGKLRTFEGHTMSPGSTHRPDAADSSAPRRRVVRYYFSQKAIKHGYAACPVKSLNANVIDDLVRALVVDHLARAIPNINLRQHEPSLRDHWLREIIARVTVALDRLTIELIDDRLASCAEAINAIKQPSPSKNIASTEADFATRALPTCPFQPLISAHDGRSTLTLAILLKRHDGRRLMLSPDGRDLLLSATTTGRAHAHPQLVHALGQAFAYRADLLRTGDTLESVAA